MRPDVVWFGEMPYAMERIYEALAGPISSFPSAPAATSTRRPASWPWPGQTARNGGAQSRALGWRGPVPEAIHGPATQVVPAYVERLLVDG